MRIAEIQFRRLHNNCTKMGHN